MYFTYNGVDSRELGLRIKDIPYDIMASRRFAETVIDGYDGALYRDVGTFDNYSLSIECLLVDNLTTDKIREIKQLFKSGRGELVLSHKPNNIYHVRLSSTLNFTEMLERTGGCILTFTVEPFSYLRSGLEYQTVSSGSKIKNQGNYYSLPLYKITPLNTNDYSITVNGKTMEFTEYAKVIYVDVLLEDVYGENGENLNNLMKIESDFVPLIDGENIITYKNISKLEVAPRWREL